MEQAPNNPTANRLGAGLTEDQLKDAVAKSGYPLQTVVGDLLRSKVVAEDANFQVQEEWSYVDKDSEQLRTIDLLADLVLYDWKRQPRVRPHLNLLIECKQSALPFIFFEGIRTPWLRDFPTIAGLHKDKIVITSDDDPSSWTYSVPHALDLAEDPFQAALRTCHTLSKCVRKGADVELSGSDAYNGLVLPLAKALQHFVRSERPVETAWYFDCHATLAVAIVDAPMISVGTSEAGPTLTAVPWVRVVRHEYDEEAERFDRNQLRIVEVVHKEYFDTYLDEYVLPFAQRFAERVLRHPTELATGVAFVPGMGAHGWDPFEHRMRPRSPKTRVSRVTAIGRNILRLFSRKARLT